MQVRIIATRLVRRFRASFYPRNWPWWQRWIFWTYLGLMLLLWLAVQVMDTADGRPLTGLLFLALACMISPLMYLWCVLLMFLRGPSIPD